MKAETLLIQDGNTKSVIAGAKVVRSAIKALVCDTSHAGSNWRLKLDGAGGYLSLHCSALFDDKESYKEFKLCSDKKKTLYLTIISDRGDTITDYFYIRNFAESKQSRDTVGYFTLENTP